MLADTARRFQRRIANTDVSERTANTSNANAAVSDFPARLARNEEKKKKKTLKGHPALASLAQTPLAVAAVKHRLSLPEGISSEDKYEIPQLMLV